LLNPYYCTALIYIYAFNKYVYDYTILLPFVSNLIVVNAKAPAADSKNILSKSLTPYMTPCYNFNRRRKYGKT